MGIAIGAVLREVARLYGQVQRKQASCLHQVTSTQCHVLTELGRTGQLTQQALLHRLSLDKAWISRAVSSLVGEGLVVRIPYETDRRSVWLRLTENGQTRYLALNAMLNEQAEQLMRHIPQAEHERVMQALCLLVDGLRRATDCLSLSADGTRPPTSPPNVRRTETQRVSPAASAAARPYSDAAIQRGQQ